MSKIEWTGETWNPVVGCSVLSPGCTNCYAMRMAARLELMSKTQFPHYAGLTKPSKAGAVWTGKVALAPDGILYKPLTWKQPRTVFPCSMADLFHADVPDGWIDRVFAVMAMTPQHTYQVLTKRSARLREYICTWSPSDIFKRQRLIDEITREVGRYRLTEVTSWKWPLPNVWLGVSAERQQEADERIPDLLATPAAVRFVSAEPLLGPIDFQRIDWNGSTALCALDRPGINWVIVGGESGPGARPMHPDWARSIRDQCAAAGTAFFFKQWGAWAPGECAKQLSSRTETHATWFDNRWITGRITPSVSAELHRDDEPDVYLLGKKSAGRLLDGVEHNHMPERTR